jgi:V8-like Glu-specific endopeptidase
MTWGQPALIALRETLARLYPREADTRRVVDDAGLDHSYIEHDPKAINYWNLILRHARDRPGKIERIIDVALSEHPESEALQRAKAGAPPPMLTGPEPDDWRGPGGPQLEKIIGTASTLVPISYLEIGLLRSRAVARIKLASTASGTGFLTTHNRLITNHHVLPDNDAARTAKAQFNYQTTADGLNAGVDEYGFVPDVEFRTSEADDWTVVRVDGDPAAKWGSLALAPAVIETGDRVNIIQHPLGQRKQVSFYSNVVVFVGSNRVQYLTDTEPGSSGSPVFDKQWNVVALHHSGGWLPEPNGADATRSFYRNEGILIDAVIAGLQG